MDDLLQPMVFIILRFVFIDIVIRICYNNHTLSGVGNEKERTIRKTD